MFRFAAVNSRSCDAILDLDFKVEENVSPKTGNVSFYIYNFQYSSGFFFK